MMTFRSPSSERKRRNHSLQAISYSRDRIIPELCQATRPLKIKSLLDGRLPGSAPGLALRITEPPQDMTSISQVPFPLYHGSSSHYLAHFEPGSPPAKWPYKSAALKLLRDAWTILRARGVDPEWWVERVLDQSSGHANWQHGALYVTPSKSSAVRYSGGGAVYGGELLTFCRRAIDQLRALDREVTRRLLKEAQSVVGFLDGGGWPLLVELSDVNVGDLSPERASNDVTEKLKELADLDEKMREMVGQQTNFRLRPGASVVTRVFRLEIENPQDPLTPFSLEQICRFPS